MCYPLPDPDDPCKDFKCLIDVKDVCEGKGGRVERLTLPNPKSAKS